MAKYTYDVKDDPAKTGKFCFVIKKDGKHIAGMGGFITARSAALAAKDCLDMFHSIRPN